MRRRGDAVALAAAASLVVPEHEIPGILGVPAHGLPQVGRLAWNGASFRLAQQNPGAPSVAQVKGINNGPGLPQWRFRLQSFTQEICHDNDE